MRYDAAIIGAGAEGLVAAALLAKAGLSTVVLERAERVGGRLASREFHPGFFANPFADEIAPIPADIYASLDLARRRAIFQDSPISLAVWPDRRNTLCLGASSALLRAARERAAAIRVRAVAEIDNVPHRSWFSTPELPAPWPGEDWMALPLAELATGEAVDADTAAHIAARALTGRAADPLLAGSSLHLLPPGFGGSGMVAGGLLRLADALAAATRDAGAEILLGHDATDIHHVKERVTGIGSAHGAEIEARAIVSTLDLKRTFLSFFQWNALPKEIVHAVQAYRMAGSTARVLFALDAKPKLPLAGAARYVAPDMAELADAFTAWRAGTLAGVLPLSLRVVSAGDPSLAPTGSAVVTTTLGAIPHKLFDGAWTREKREILMARALSALELAMPGARAHVVAAEVIAPPDIEEGLGATEGDLLGGELTADQMLSVGPWAGHPLPRTPLKGLYLVGSWLAMASATGAAGSAVAKTIIADIAAGKLK